MKQNPRQNIVRRAFSFLELQVALVLLGIALAGLVPLVVMQSKQLKRIEARLDSEETYYLVPSGEVWACKLGAPASIEAEDRKPSSPLAGEATYELKILSFDKQFTSETTLVRVRLAKVKKKETLEAEPLKKVKN